MNVIEVIGFCVVAWISGALFGRWWSIKSLNVRSPVRTGGRYFEEEQDKWRPVRKLGKSVITIGLCGVALLALLSIAIFAASPRAKLRGRQAELVLRSDHHAPPSRGYRPNLSGLSGLDTEINS